MLTAPSAYTIAVIDVRDRRTRTDDSPNPTETPGDPTGREDTSAGDFGRDGISGLLTLDRALRAREVSRPGADEERLAHELVGQLLARAEGRKRR